MTRTLISMASAIALLFFSKHSFCQAPNLGAAANFVLFTSNGTLSNTGISSLLGDIGTPTGTTSGFGNVNGTTHNKDAQASLCSSDLANLYNQLNSATPTSIHSVNLGYGETVRPGVYTISGNASLSQTLTLDALGSADAVFIFKIQGALSSTSYARVVLINSAQPSKVFWKVEGGVNLASATVMKGTIVANKGGINVGSGASLDGRGVSTGGNITLNKIVANIPIVSDSTRSPGPSAPALGSTVAYGVFSADGDVTNKGVTTVAGDIGSNRGNTGGYTPARISGSVHYLPDASTNGCAADLLTVYNYLNNLPHDIDLLSPGQLGYKLTLTPRTYRLNSAAVLTDTLYLNAAGNPNAVFVIKVNGALLSNPNAKVVLANGAQSTNVYWIVNGSVFLNDFSGFTGNIICTGAVIVGNGAGLSGRAQTVSGAFNTSSVVAIGGTKSSIAAYRTMTANNSPLAIADGVAQELVAFSSRQLSVYPNPISNNVARITLSNIPVGDYNVKMYDLSGRLLSSQRINHYTNTSRYDFVLPSTASGNYFIIVKGVQNTAIILKQKVLVL